MLMLRRRQETLWSDFQLNPQTQFIIFHFFFICIFQLEVGGGYFLLKKTDTWGRCGIITGLTLLHCSQPSATSWKHSKLIQWLSNILCLHSSVLPRVLLSGTRATGWEPVPGERRSCYEKEICPHCWLCWWIECLPTGKDLSTDEVRTGVKPRTWKVTVDFENPRCFTAFVFCVSKVNRWGFMCL